MIIHIKRSTNGSATANIIAPNDLAGEAGHADNFSKLVQDIQQRFPLADVYKMTKAGHAYPIQVAKPHDATIYAPAP